MHYVANNANIIRMWLVGNIANVWNPKNADQNANENVILTCNLDCKSKSKCKWKFNKKYMQTEAQRATANLSTVSKCKYNVEMQMWM